jgi:hypothetical protein
MTNFVKPVEQRPQAWLAHLRTLAATSAATTTEYVVEYPPRTAGDTRGESERGVSMGIKGSLTHDHAGNATGLTGWGQASKKTGSWVKL